MDITRRQIIRCLFFFPVAGLLPRRTEAQVEPQDKHFTLNLFNIAGFQYYRGPKLVRRMRAGEELTLVVEPDNPHDIFAVRIERKGTKLGYVPRTDNRHLSRLLEQRAQLDCRVVEVRSDEVPWRMVRVEVGMRG